MGVLPVCAEPWMRFLQRGAQTAHHPALNLVSTVVFDVLAHTHTYNWEPCMLAPLTRSFRETKTLHVHISEYFVDTVVATTYQIPYAIHERICEPAEAEVSKL